MMALPDQRPLIKKTNAYLPNPPFIRMAGFLFKMRTRLTDLAGI